MMGGSDVYRANRQLERFLTRGAHDSFTCLDHGVSDMERQVSREPERPDGTNGEPIATIIYDPKKQEVRYEYVRDREQE